MENETGFDFGEEVVETGLQEETTPSIFENQEETVEETYTEPEDIQYDENGDPIEETQEENDYLSQLLRAKGIDRNNIEITEEDGSVTTVKFDDLSDDEKAAILSGEAPVENVESAITDNDLQILNFFRANRINSLQEFADGIANQAVQNYIASQSNTQETDIDRYSDDEIIAYDFIQRFGDEMTDEEIDAEIERLKEDEEAYNKRVNLLRTSYKNQEEAQRKLYEEQQTTQREANEKEFITAYASAVNNLNTIQGIDLEDNDKQDIFDFVITKDKFGKTELAKALDDPEQVLRIAWFLKYGEQAAQEVRDYFAQQLANQRKATATPKPVTTRAVSRPATTQKPTQLKTNKRSGAFVF